MNLFGTIAKSEPGYLVADGSECGIVAIPCEPGHGSVKPGTVMYRKENGMFAPASKTEAVDAQYLAVLGETVDTDANAEIAEDARAFESGRLLRRSVVLADGNHVDAAVELTLRKQGIVLRAMDGDGEFDNKKSE